MVYINTCKAEFSVSEQPAHREVSDVTEFIDDHVTWRAASIAADGIAVAMEDGELLAKIAEDIGLVDDEMERIAEELHYIAKL